MKRHDEKTLQSIKKLEEYRKRLPSLGNDIIREDMENMSYMDMIIMGIVKRSLSTSAAIESLVLDWNIVSARAMLRIHLDTVLRFSAFWLSSDPQKMAKQVLFDRKQIRKMEDKDENTMHDRYLADKLGEDFKFIPKLYDKTCTYVHFTERYIWDTVLAENEKGTTYFAIHEKDYNLPEASWIEVITYTTQCLLIIEAFLKEYQKLKAKKE